MSGVHQFVPMLHRRDAVGEHTRALRDALVDAGIESTIYTELCDLETASETSHYREYAGVAEPGDVLVYQMATASKIAAWLIDRPERLVVNYHSITPPRFFARWNNNIARLQATCLAELAMIAPRADLGIAISAFDEAELRSAGCERTEVVPVAGVQATPIDPDVGHLGAVRRWKDRAGNGGAGWLSVGRLVPNKAHHQTMAALFAARETIDPGATLRIVGSPSEPAYAAALRRFAVSLGLQGAVSFVSGLDSGSLAAEYRSADVLVMLSEHEGFGLPLVESMCHGTPIVALGAGAVPEVVADAAVLIDSSGPIRVAAEVTGLVAHEDRRSALVAAGHERVRRLGIEGASSRLVSLLASMQGSPTY